MKLQTALEDTDYRAVLERGDILLFPHGGFEIPVAVRTALMGAAQDARSFHKNIAYKPNRDQVSKNPTPVTTGATSLIAPPLP